MDFDELSKNVQALWESRPAAVLLTVLGFFVFLFLVIDAWRHKRRHRRKR